MIKASHQKESKGENRHGAFYLTEFANVTINYDLREKKVQPICFCADSLDYTVSYVTMAV